MDVTVDLQAYCAECGEGICDLVSQSRRRGTGYIEVYPCNKCIDAAKDEGHDEGYEQGSREASKES